VTSGQFILAIHLAWAIWMICGVVLAVAGLRWRRFLRWRVFRTLHLIGLLFTATVPLWASGVCPLTRWEDAFSRSAGSGAPEPFLARLMADILYVDIEPTILSVVTAFGALVTLVIFIVRPPWGARTGG